MSEPRHSTYHAILLLGAALLPAPSHGYDYSGRAMIGVFRGTESHKEDPNKPKNNDKEFVVADLYFLANKLTKQNLTFTLDLRDRYNNFGRVDKDSLTLVAKNEPKLNQLVLRQPGRPGGIFWSVGRFHIAGDRFLGHDGVEAGKRSGNWRFGAFGGLAPTSTYKNSLNFAKEPTQMGAFATYERSGSSGMKRRYFATALAMRELKLRERELPTDKAQENFLTFRAIDQQSLYNRLLVDGKIDFTDGFIIQNLLTRWSRRLTSRIYGHLTYLRYDFKEYDIMRDLRDELVASTYDELGAKLSYRLSATAMIDGQALTGKRTVDDKSKTQLSLNFRKAKLLKGRMSAYAGVSQTANFVSKDNALKVGANLYQNRGEIGVRGEYRTEAKEDGTSLTANILGVHGSWLATRSLLVGGSFQYAADQLHTISTVLISVGYRFDSQAMTPIRKSSPGVGRVSP